MEDRPAQTIYKLKITIVSLLLAVVGVAAIVIAKLVEHRAGLQWLTYLPLFELGSTLFITGTLVNVWNYVDGRDRERREDARLRRLLHEAAPDFRDAVVEGFAVSPDDLQRVATPALLDGLVTNALALRLGDTQFAHELYEQIRDQSFGAPERWHDVEVRVKLSSALERNAEGVPLFDVLVEWEFTTVPSHVLRRFACVSDRDEFHELVTEIPSTSTWFMTPRPGLDASNRESFELLYFAVDGEVQPIRRTSRKSGQTYSTTIDEATVRGEKPVRIKHVYRVQVAQDAHRLFIELAQPCRGVSLEVDYAATSIARLTVSDLVSSTQKPRVTQLPEASGDHAISIDVPGWVLPRAGFTVVWTLESEDASAGRRPARPR